MEVIKRERELRELKEFEEEKRAELKQNIVKVFLMTDIQLNSTKTEQEHIAQKMMKEMDQIKNDVTSNKDKILEFILDNVLDVDMTIPDVIGAKFSDKLGAK